LRRTAKPQPGETPVVAAASGAVGSVVGQTARVKGCRVVGVAGGERKCRFVREELGSTPASTTASPTWPSA
jgi:NADPH-dependent curcumin reductase CurA